MRRPYPLFLLLAFAAVELRAAIDIRQSTAAHLSTGEILSVSTVLVAERVVLDGEANDDVFTIAPEFRLTGTCRNDLWVLGGDARINGVIEDHLRVAANFLTVSGRVENGIAALAASIRLAESSSVRGGAWVMGENVMLVGSVEGPLHVTAVNCTLSGRIKGDVNVTATDLVVMPGTTIDGNLYYTTPDPLVLDPTVQLSGDMKRVVPVAETRGASIPWEIILVRSLLSFLASLLTGTVLMTVFPAWVGRSVISIRQGAARSGLIGAVALAFMPMLALVTAFTIVGIPLALMIAGFCGALLYLGKLVVAVALGSVLMRWQGPLSIARAVVALITGLIPIYAAGLLPDVGPIISLMVHTLGMGALAGSLFRAADPAVPPPLTANDPR